MRPGSSMSQHPQPSAPSRPASSLSRPLSSASQRTASRVSHRPFSRLSQRPSTRQSRALCQALVTKITGLVIDQDDAYDDVFDLAIRRIEAVGKQAVAPDLQTVQAQLRGLSRKARIQFHDELADAFDICGKKLTAETEKRGDLDNEISTSNLPEHLQLLFLLSSRPSSSTLEFATQLVDRAQNPRSSPSGITWAEILKEEPFEGDHWQGAYGLPPGSIVGQEDQARSTDSSPSLSPVSDSESEDRDGLFSILDSEGSSDVSEREITPPPSTKRNNQSIMQHRVAESLRLHFELETVRKHQYWRKDWRIDAELDRQFDLSEPSTLRTSVQRIMSPGDGNYQIKPENEKYINEHDAVREILISLQGRPSFLFERSLNKDGLPVTLVREDAPSLLHLTPSSQQSILSKFGHLATTLNRLRVFFTEVLRNTADISLQRHNSRTIEAFSEALELQVTLFEAYMAQKEEKILRAHSENGKSIVVSLLSLEIVIRDDFSYSFDELLRIICSSFPGSSWLDRDRILGSVRLSPSSFSSRLLDSLFDAIQSSQSFGDTVTASWLRRVFLKTAEPVWKMLGRWLRDGIFMPESSNSAYDQNVLPQEFFIESNGLDITDTDFWAQGYSVRTRSLDDDLSTERPDVPVFLQSLVDKILGAGKSIGLLRILGHGQSVEYGELSAAAWPTFENFILKLFDGGPLLGSQRMDMSSAHLTSDNLSLLLSDHLLPICTSAEKMLKNVLYSDCDLLHHFHMVEDLLLCRRGDVIADFCDVLFSAIDSKKIWTDYHFLNTAYREAIYLRNTQGMDPTLVRLLYKSSGRTAHQRSVKRFDGLTVDYAAPFPFVFVIDSDAKQVYSAIFVLLIKIRRAKTFLDNILLRGSAESILRARDELKIFYTTRSKLSWFVNTFMDFICSYVLHVEIEAFHSSLRKAGSLDDIIDLHQKHLHSIEKLCFLNEKTAAVHRALMSILDMSVTFSDYFVAFAGDTTLNMSRAPMSRSRRHRSRRQRREARDIVSLEPVQSFRDEESDSSDSDLDESVILQEIVGDDSQSVPAASFSESFGEGGFFDRNEKMMKDLDSLVRYVRREVERLAMASGGSQFGVLAFALQDWDL